MSEYLLTEKETLFLPLLADEVSSPNMGKLEQVMATRGMTPADPAMMTAVRTLLGGIGEDPEREGLLDTPKRVAKMLREVTSGYEVDLEAVINGAVFAEDFGEPVVVRDIQYHSLCEHHMLPFYGKAHVAYMPSGKVVGLSKIPRVVEVFARRLQVQERLTAQIADFLVEKLEPAGVAVVLEGTHFCAVIRGVRQTEGVMRTQAVRGGEEVGNKLLDLAAGR
jgi:GTP cyclohydrolase I